MVKRMKTQATDRKRIFVKCILGKIFVSKIYKELLKFNYRKMKKSI